MQEESSEYEYSTTSTTYVLPKNVNRVACQVNQEHLVIDYALLLHLSILFLKFNESRLASVSAITPARIHFVLKL